MLLVVALMCWVAVGMGLAYMVSLPQFGMSLLGMDPAGQRQQAELDRANAEAGLVEPVAPVSSGGDAERVEQVAAVLPSSRLITTVAVVCSVIGGLFIVLWLGETPLLLGLSVASAAVICGLGLIVLFGLTLARLTEQAEQADEQAQQVQDAAGTAVEDDDLGQSY